MNEIYYWIVGAAAIVTLGLNIAVMIRGGALNLVAREEALTKSFKEELEKLRSETTHNLASINQDVNSSQDLAMQRFSETVAAIREQVSHNALYCERTFLSKPEFYEHNRRNENQLNQISNQLTERFNRLEKRLDEMNRP